MYIPRTVNYTAIKFDAVGESWPGIYTSYFKWEHRLPSRKKEFIINFVKEKQDWKHKHQDVDSGYFRGCNRGAGIYIWQVIFLSSFFTDHVLIMLLGQKSIYFSVLQFFIYKMEIICIIHLHRSRERSAQIYTPRFWERLVKKGTLAFYFCTVFKGMNHFISETITIF